MHTRKWLFVGIGVVVLACICYFGSTAKSVKRPFREVRQMSRNATFLVTVFGSGNGNGRWDASLIALDVDKPQGFRHVQGLDPFMSQNTMVTQIAVKPRGDKFYIGTDHEISEFSGETLQRIRSVPIGQFGFSQDHSLAHFMMASQDRLFFFVAKPKPKIGEDFSVEWQTDSSPAKGSVVSDTVFMHLGAFGRSVCFGPRGKKEFKLLSCYGPINVPYYLASPNMAQLQDLDVIDYSPKYGLLFSYSLYASSSLTEDMVPPIFRIDPTGSKLSKMEETGYCAKWTRNGAVFIVSLKPYKVYLFYPDTGRRESVLTVSSDMCSENTECYAPVFSPSRERVILTFGNSDRYGTRYEFVLLDLEKKEYRCAEAYGVLDFQWLERRGKDTVTRASLSDDFSLVEAIPPRQIDENRTRHTFTKERVERVLENAGIKYKLFGNTEDGYLQLSLGNSNVTNILPLAELPIEILFLMNTAVEDLTPLEKMPLKFLNIDGTKVSDLSPLSHLPLNYLAIRGTQVKDLTPLRGLALQDLWCQPESITNGWNGIREMESLRTINGMSPDEFFEKYKTGKE